jgi:hypothetical protein
VPSSTTWVHTVPPRRPCPQVATSDGVLRAYTLGSYTRAGSIVAGPLPVPPPPAAFAAAAAAALPGGGVEQKGLATALPEEEEEEEGEEAGSRPEVGHAKTRLACLRPQPINHLLVLFGKAAWAVCPVLTEPQIYTPLPPPRLQAEPPAAEDLAAKAAAVGLPSDSEEEEEEEGAGPAGQAPAPLAAAAPAAAPKPLFGSAPAAAFGLASFGAPAGAGPAKAASPAFGAIGASPAAPAAPAFGGVGTGPSPAGAFSFGGAPGAAPAFGSSLVAAKEAPAAKAGASKSQSAKAVAPAAGPGASKPPPLPSREQLAQVSTVPAELRMRVCGEEQILRSAASELPARHTAGRRAFWGLPHKQFPPPACV